MPRRMRLAGESCVESEDGGSVATAPRLSSGLCFVCEIIRQTMKTSKPMARMYVRTNSQKMTSLLKGRPWARSFPIPWEAAW